MMIWYYIHTTHIFILISFFKDRRYAGEAPTKGPPTSNLRGIGGIFAYGGHRWNRRIPLPLMPPCKFNDLHVIKWSPCNLMISMCHIWNRRIPLRLRENYIIYASTCTVCSSVEYVLYENLFEMKKNWMENTKWKGKHKMKNNWMENTKWNHGNRLMPKP